MPWLVGGGGVPVLEVLVGRSAPHLSIGTSPQEHPNGEEGDGPGDEQQNLPGFHDESPSRGENRLARILFTKLVGLSNDRADAIRRIWKQRKTLKHGSISSS